MKIHNNILSTIGNTPLVKLNVIVADMPCTVLAKVESTNPGNSIKDRMALKMIEDAEKSGTLKPGGTIIEGTSGNTGMGLAIAAVIKGYKCIFTTTDKQSKEKVDALKAFGAEVIVCPTDVEPEDPRSYYSVSTKLAKEIPNSWKPNQYDNLSNSLAHYETTGPEIWDQTDGKITHLIVGVGTGGTICGTGKYLKEKNPNIKLIGIDTYGSVFKKYKETGEFDENEIYPYITEGIGEDFLPKNVDFSIIDQFEKVSDKDAAIYTRLIPRTEGIFAGNSAGAAIAGMIQLKHQFKSTDLVVIIFHDHGTRYLGKMFNEEWMADRGFIDKKKGATALDIIRKHKNLRLITAKSNQTIQEVYQIMKQYGISQMPILDKNDFIGSINDSDILEYIINNPLNITKEVSVIMNKPYPIVNYNDTIDSISRKIDRNNPALIVQDMGGNYHIITKFDVIESISEQ